jgi:hypothetical protein
MPYVDNTLAEPADSENPGNELGSPRTYFIVIKFGRLERIPEALN